MPSLREIHNKTFLTPNLKKIEKQIKLLPQHQQIKSRVYSRKIDSIQSRQSFSLTPIQKISHTIQNKSISRAKSRQIKPTLQIIKEIETKVIEQDEQEIEGKQRKKKIDYNIINKRYQQIHIPKFESKVEKEKSIFTNQEMSKTQDLIYKISGKKNSQKRFYESVNSHFKQNQPKYFIQKEKEPQLILRNTSALDNYIQNLQKNFVNIEKYRYLVKTKILEEKDGKKQFVETNDPYDLTIQKYQHINDSQNPITQYYTISSKGLCHYINKRPVDFIKLQVWLKERETYDLIKRLNFFKKFRKWKTLKMWKKNVSKQRIQTSTKALEKQLFILNPYLRVSLIKFKSVMTNMEQEIRLITFKENKSLQIEDFKDVQFKLRKQISKKIETFSSESKKIVKQGFDSCIDELILKHKKKNQNVHAIQSQSRIQTNQKQQAYKLLGFNHSMTYEQRSSLRSQCCKLIRFSYLVDFYTMQSLINIYLKTYMNTINIFSKQINNDEIIIIRDANKTSINNPMFEVELVIEITKIKKQDMIEEKITDFLPYPQGIHQIKDFNLLHHVRKSLQNFQMKKVIPEIAQKWVRIMPDLQQFSDTIRYCFDEGLNSLISFERWSKNSNMIKYFNVLQQWDDAVGLARINSEQNFLNPKQWLQSMSLSQIKGKVYDLILVSYKKNEQYLKQNFSEYLMMYWEHKNFDFNIFKSQNLNSPAQTFQNSLKLLQYQKKQFSNIPIHADIGMFRINSMNIKQFLLPIPNLLLAQLQQYIPQMIKQMNKQIKQWLENQTRKLKKGSNVNIDQFVEQSQQLKNIYEQYPIIKQKMDLIRQLLITMHNFKIDIKEQKKEIQTQTKNAKQNLQKTIQIVQSSIERNIDNFSKEIKNYVIPNLINNIKNTIKKANNSKFLQLKIDICSILQQLQNVEKEAKQIQMNLQKYRIYQNVLGLQNVQFQDIQEMKSAIGMRILLWKTYKQWVQYQNQQRNMQISKINIQKMNQKLDSFNKIIDECQQSLPPNAIIQKIKRCVINFYNILPVLNTILNPYLKQYHYKQIKQTIGQININQDMLLQQILKMQIGLYKNQLQVISKLAYKQQENQEMLCKIQHQWKNIMFKLEKQNLQGKNYKEIYQLKDSEKTTAQFENLLIQMSKILGSNYIKYIHSKAEGIQKQLLMGHQLLDQMIQVHNSWSYVDNIVIINEIKQKVPQSSEFELIDKNFRAEMKKIFKNKNVFKWINSDLLDKLKTWKQSLNLIKHSFNKYLQQKRVKFARFYFISNQELLQLMSKSNNLDFIIKNLEKLFPGILNIQLEGQMAKNIGNFVSASNQKFPLVRHISLKIEVDALLISIQEVMIQSFKKYLYTCKKDLQISSYEDWLQANYLYQCLILSSGYAWTFYTQLALEQINQNSKSIQQQLFEMDKQTRILIKKIKSHPKKLIYHIYQDMLCQNYYFIQIVKSLQKIPSINLYSMEWLKFRRFYLDQNTLQTNWVIKQGLHTIKYGYQYYGKRQRIVLTPITDRVNYSLMTCLQLNNSPVLYGGINSQKYETLRDFALSAAILLIIQNCSQYNSFREIALLIQGLCEQGAWGIYLNIQRLSTNVLKFMAQMLNNVYFSLHRGRETLYLYQKQIIIKSGFGFFLTCHQRKHSQNYVNRLKKPYRIISVPQVDISTIIKIKLCLLGFKEPQKNAKKIIYYGQIIKLAGYNFYNNYYKQILKKCKINEDSHNQINKQIIQNQIIGNALYEFSIRYENNQYILEELKSLYPFTISQESYHQQKLISFKQAINNNMAVILLGLPGCGKTTLLKKYLQKSQTLTFFPSSCLQKQLYGYQKNEWVEGVLSKMIKTYPQGSQIKIIFDGFENIHKLFLMIQENKLISNNFQSLNFRNKYNIKLIFEVDNIDQFDPSVIGKSSIIYLQLNEINIKSMLDSRFDKNFSKILKIIEFCKSQKLHYQFNQIHIIQALNNLLDSYYQKLLSQKVPIDKRLLQYVLVLCIIWTIGMFIDQSKWQQTSIYIKNVFNNILFPNGSVFHFYLIQQPIPQFMNWEDNLLMNNKMNIRYLPTIHSESCIFMIDLLLSNNKNVHLFGKESVGKTTVINELFFRKYQKMDCNYISIGISKLKKLQQSIENSLAKLSKKLLGVKTGKQKTIIVLQDLSMNSKNAFNELELIRMFVQKKFLFDYQFYFYKKIDQNVNTLISMRKKQYSKRVLRHFNPIYLAQGNQSILFQIFYPLISSKQYSQEAILKIFGFATTLHMKFRELFKPCPKKCHYRIKLENIVRVFQSIKRIKKIQVEQFQHILKHEFDREYKDFLIQQDKIKYQQQVYKNQIYQQQKIYLSDIHKTFHFQYDKINFQDAVKIIQQKLNYYKQSSNQKCYIILQNNIIEQILCISRILSHQKGSIICVTHIMRVINQLCKFVNFINLYQYVQINNNNFLEKIKNTIKTTGIQGQNISLITNLQNLSQENCQNLYLLLNEGSYFPIQTNMIIHNQLLIQFRNLLNYPDQQFFLIKSFKQRILRYLHLIGICKMGFKNNLYKNCTIKLIDYCEPAYISISNNLLSKNLIDNHKIQMLKNIHQLYYNEAKKHNIQRLFNQQTFYRFVQLIMKIYKQKNQKYQKSQILINQGINKINITVQKIQQLKIQLENLRPLLSNTSKILNQKLNAIQEDNLNVMEKQNQINKQTLFLNQQSNNIMQIKQETLNQLDQAQPQIQKAQSQLNKISTIDIYIISKMPNPPQCVPHVVQAVLTLLGKDAKNWKKQINNANNFIQAVKNLDRNHIPDQRIKKLKILLHNRQEQFDPNIIKTKVSWAGSLCSWLLAVKKYIDATKQLQPKKKKLLQLEKKYDKSNQQLRIKQNQLKVIRSKLQKIRIEIDKINNNKGQIQQTIQDFIMKKQRAQKIVNLTTIFYSKWQNQIKQIKNNQQNLVEYSILASIIITYSGPFHYQIRNILFKKVLAITEINQFNLNYFIKFQFSQLIQNNLPKTLQCQQLSLITLKSLNYKYIIDPYKQAFKFLKQGFNVIIVQNDNPKIEQYLMKALIGGLFLIVYGIEQKINQKVIQLIQNQYFFNNGSPIIELFGKTFSVKESNIFLISLRNWPCQQLRKINIINWTLSPQSLKEKIINQIFKINFQSCNENILKSYKILYNINLQNLERQNRILNMFSQFSLQKMLVDLEIIDFLNKHKYKKLQQQNKIKENQLIITNSQKQKKKFQSISLYAAKIFRALSYMINIDKLYQYSFQQYIQMVYNKFIKQQKQLQQMIQHFFSYYYQSIYLKDRMLFLYFFGYCFDPSANIQQQFILFSCNSIQQLKEYQLFDNLKNQDIVNFQKKNKMNKLSDHQRLILSKIFRKNELKSELIKYFINKTNIRQEKITKNYQIDQFIENNNSKKFMIILGNFNDFQNKEIYWGNKKKNNQSQNLYRLSSQEIQIINQNQINIYYSYQSLSNQTIQKCCKLVKEQTISSSMVLQDLYFQFKKKIKKSNIIWPIILYHLSLYHRKYLKLFSKKFIIARQNIQQILNSINLLLNLNQCQKNNQNFFNNCKTITKLNYQIYDKYDLKICQVLLNRFFAKNQETEIPFMIKQFKQDIDFQFLGISQMQVKPQCIFPLFPQKIQVYNNISQKQITQLIKLLPQIPMVKQGQFKQFLQNQKVKFQNLKNHLLKQLNDIYQKLIGNIQIQQKDQLIIQTLNMGLMPQKWLKYSYSSIKSLFSYFADFKNKSKILQWQAPSPFDISKIFQPYLLLQTYTSLLYKAQKLTFDIQFKFLQLDKQHLLKPLQFFTIYGLKIQFGAWDRKRKCLIQHVFHFYQGQSYLPLMQPFINSYQKQNEKNLYEIPVYREKTKREYLFPIKIPFKQSSLHYWIMKGTFIVCDLQ